jgi:hypothetical protein
MPVYAGLPMGLKPQRTEAIKWAMPYPPRMTAAKLTATTARRNAAVMVYSTTTPRATIRWAAHPYPGSMMVGIKADAGTTLRSRAATASWC